MPTSDVAMLVTHRKLPPALVAARLQHKLAFAGRHARQKAVLTAPRNFLRIPRLAHGWSILPENIHLVRRKAAEMLQLDDTVSAHKERRACSTPHRNRLNA